MLSKGWVYIYNLVPSTVHTATFVCQTHQAKCKLLSRELQSHLAQMLVWILNITQCGITNMHNDTTDNSCRSLVQFNSVIPCCHFTSQMNRNKKKHYACLKLRQWQKHSTEWRLADWTNTDIFGSDNPHVVSFSMDKSQSRIQDKF